MPGITIGIGIGLDWITIAEEEDVLVQKYAPGVVFGDLSAAALTKSVIILSLGAGQVLHVVKIKPSAAFTGGAVASCTLSLGITGDLAKYGTAFDVFQAPGATIFQVSAGPWSENHTAATDIKLTAVSTGANLSALTAGAADIWIWTTTAL